MMCLVVTPEIQKVTDKISKTYPEAAERAKFDASMCAEWIGSYNTEMNRKPDFVPDYTALVHFIEKKRNMDGKSFLYVPEEIEYNMPGQKRQTYTVIGNRIFNRKGQEVFAEGIESLKTHRARVLANLAVQRGNAVVVEHKGHKYVVYNNKAEDIMSVTSSKIMQWGNENGDRKAILALARAEFSKKETPAANQMAASEGKENSMAAVPVVIWNGYWTREQVAQQQDKVFLFGDNTNDRVSTHYVPSSTQAVIRGLPNAIGIDTKKNRGTSAQSYFTNADFNQFKAQVDSAIDQARATGRTIVIPADGIGTGKAMLKEKAPKCFEYLQNELQKLKTPSQNLDNSDNNGTFAPENAGDQIMPAVITTAIETGNWSTEALRELDNLINDLENGKVTYQRFPQEASRGMHQGGRANETASLLLRGSKGSGGEVTLSVGERYERDKREQPVQERIVESWAKAAGIWHDNLDTITGKKQIAEEGEAKVFYNDGDTHVTKILSTEYFITPQFALDRITLHNTLFPEAPLKITGFGRSSDGEFKFIVKQPFIQGEHASKEEIQQFIERAGFTKSDKDKGNTYTTDDIYVSDLHDENVLKTKEGNLIVIDADVRWNTPELNRGGKHVIDNSLVKTNPVLEQFKKDVDMLSGYFEGGGRTLLDDFPNIPTELVDKLADYFFGNGELSIDDYRTLWNNIEFKDATDGSGFRIPEPRKAPQASPAPSEAPSVEVESKGLGESSVGLGLTDEDLAAAARRQAEANKPKPERPKSVAYESALNVSDSRVAKFKRTFSPQQIKDRGAMIADMFSDILDDAVQNEIDALQDVVDSDSASEDEKTQAKQRINALRDPVNGRQLAAQELGIPAIASQIRQQIEWNLESAPEDRRQLWQNTLDYFEDLFNAQASLDIEEREGIRIVGLKIAEQTASDDENDAQDNGDDEVGHVASGSDGWSYQVRYTDPFDSLSKKVRSMLYDVDRPASETDDLGMQRKYPMGQIYASLLSYLAKNMHSADDFIHVIKDFDSLPESLWDKYKDFNEEKFQSLYPNGYPVFPVLEDMRNVYPWVSQIIDRLTKDYVTPERNTSLRYPSTGGAMASQFYTNFRKAYIPYGKIQKGDGKFGVTPLNYEMEERVQYDKLEANYNNRMILTEHSVYDSQGRVNKKNTQWLQYQINKVIDQVRDNRYADYPELMAQWQQDPESVDFGQEDVDEFNGFVDTLRNILQSYGIDATQDGTVAYLMMNEGEALYGMLQKLSYINNIIKDIDDSKVDSFNYIVDLKNQYGENQWKHFFDGAGMITDQSYMQSFYDSASKKTKYSYSADNYLMKTFRGLAMGSLEERRAYMDEHFGRFAWFRNPKTGEWLNKWLEFWYNYDGNQKEIPYRNIDNVTDYSNDSASIRQYMKWTTDDVWEVQQRSYDPESKKNTAYYLAPIFSDSPMSMTVLGPRMSMEELLYGHTDSTGVRHQGAFVQLVNQEMWRIGLVQQRAQAIKDGVIKPISNFDGARGRQFCFLPELNNYVFEDTGETFLDTMRRLKDEKATLSMIENFQIKAIKDIIDRKMNEYVLENREHYEENPLSEQQYYNMVYGNAAIIQLTTIDLAYYKNDTDFQKRYKEVYAGGIQLNTNSKYGRKTENVVLLSDDIITSPNYDEIASVIDGSKNLTEADKKAIKSVFMDINVADAQAIRSMHSFRSVLDMMGVWDDRKEEALEHFRNGEWNREDFDIIYQTIKPFVYSVIDRNDGFGGTIPVPQQNKNSEICALMMYDLISNGLNKSPYYKAISRFMDESLDANGEHLIDMVQFESAGKVGNQGVVNISFNPDKVMSVIEQGVIVNGNEYELYTDEIDANDFAPNDLEHAAQNYEAIKHQLDLRLQDGRMPQDDYNKIMAYLRPTEDEIIDMLSQAVLVDNPDGSKGINTEIVHTIPFENYYQQQPTPEHHIDAEATFGSQARNIAVADFPDSFEISLKGKNGSKTFNGKDAVIDFYYELLNENLIEDFFGKGSKKGLKGIFESKENFRDAVMDIVRGNPKYGRDFAEAMQLDSNGNFVLSPNSPTMFNLMQELVTSFFKNRITKQTINGAALIQAAGIGLDKDLRILFDEDGKLLGAECYMPLTTKKFFEPLLEKKMINGQEVQVLSPRKLKAAGLDKAVGYRIPTENKSSMMPLIIKDFTPLQNGSAIVLPAEITAMAGSDFDVDKMFIMLSSFSIQNYDMRKAREDYAKQNAIFKELMSHFSNSSLAEDFLEDDTDDFKAWFDENKEDYRLNEPRIHKIEYDFSKTPKENGRKARNNMLIQMIYGILTSKDGAESLFNPQGFSDVKRAAKIIRILTTPALKEQLLRNATNIEGVIPSNDQIIAEFLSLVQQKYPHKYDEVKNTITKLSEEDIRRMYIEAVTSGNKVDSIKLLLDSSIKDLENFIRDYSPAESPVFPQTFIHSHARNMAGAIQIGIYAIQGSMAAKYQRADVRLRPEQRFTLNGRQITNVDTSDGGKRLKNVGQMIGASADNGKDPNLSDMGSTSKTAPMIGYMLRTGMSHLEAALIINQQHMKASKYNPDNKYWKDILGKTPLANTPANVTTEMLIRSIISPFELTAEEDKAIAGVCYRILQQCKAMEYVTQVSRADSPNGAMQNSYAKARIQQYKVDLLQAKMGQKDFPFVRIKEAVSNNAVDTTASEDEVREQLKGQRMGFLHGMYAFGIGSFQNLVSPYFFGAGKHFDDAIVKPILYNLNEKLSDEEKTGIVNSIYTSYITYMLSASELFGNEEGSSMKAKRDYYLDSFPDDYIKIIKENEDIRDLLSTVLQVRNFGSRKRVILQDVGSLSKGQKQDVQRRFESLAYSDNPVARNLAKDLFVYSYFDNGLQFTHDSFSHLFTTEYLTNFPAYTETLNNLGEELTPEEEENFIMQFLVTYPNAAYNVNNIITSDDVGGNNGDTIRIDLNNWKMRKYMINEVMSPNPLSEGINVYPYIQYNGDVYILDKNLFEQYPGTPVYRRIQKYSTFSRLPLFSRQMSVKEMADKFPLEAQNYQGGETPSFDGVDAPMAHNEGYDDPAVGSDMYAAFDAMDDFEAPDWEDDPTDNSDNGTSKYQSEGEAELRDPFC